MHRWQPNDSFANNSLTRDRLKKSLLRLIPFRAKLQRITDRHSQSLAFYCLSSVIGWAEVGADGVSVDDIVGERSVGS